MRLPSLLLALAACNPATSPACHDAAAWRDLIDLLRYPLTAFGKPEAFRAP